VRRLDEVEVEKIRLSLKNKMKRIGWLRMIILWVNERNRVGCVERMRKRELGAWKTSGSEFKEMAAVGRMVAFVNTGLLNVWRKVVAKDTYALRIVIEGEF
jgi:hypothetical protein